MNSIPYMTGFLCGLAIVAIATLLIRFAFKKRGFLLCGEYDERQLAVQGRAYKSAFFTMLILTLSSGVFAQMTGLHVIEPFPCAALCMWPSLCVFATCCIAGDAYVALRARRKTLILLFGFCSLVYLFIGAYEAIWGEGLVSGGMLNLNVVHLITGASCLYIAGALSVKALIDRRREEESE